MLKLWLVDDIASWDVPEECDQYDWNGTCLQMPMPEYINQITPVREAEVRESIDGTPYIFCNIQAIYADYSLEFTLNEKERLAFDKFVYALSQHTLTHGGNTYPFPYFYYTGLENTFDYNKSQYTEDIRTGPDSNFYMAILSQDIQAVEYDSNTDHMEEEEVIEHKFRINLVVRAIQRVKKGSKDNIYLVKLEWDDYEILLGYDTLTNVNVYGWLSNLSGFSSTSEVNGFGSVANLTVTLAAYQQYNELPSEHPMKKVHQHIDNIRDATVSVLWNNTVIFKGTPYTPFVWDSGTYELSFDCLMNVKNKQMGFQPDFDSNEPLLMSDQNWPHTFGTVLFEVQPLCPTPETILTKTLYITQDFADHDFDIYKSGETFELTLDPTRRLPEGNHTFILELANNDYVRFQGIAGEMLLAITDFNIPWGTDIPLVPIEQYDTGYVDDENYQPNTFIINAESWPYLVGKHILGEAERLNWEIGDQGAFSERLSTIQFWATVVGQDGPVLYVNDIRELEYSREIRLSGWKATNILYVMENRIFQPNSWELVALPEVRQADDNNTAMDRRVTTLETGPRRTDQWTYVNQEILAWALPEQSRVICTSWVYDKLYPISLDTVTLVNNAYQSINNKLYQLPVDSIYAYNGTDFILKQHTFDTYDAPSWSPVFDLEDIRPYLPEECTFMLLYDHLEHVWADTTNTINNDWAVFDFLVEKYTDIEVLPYDYADVHTLMASDFYTRDIENVKTWLSGMMQERGYKIIVHGNRTAELVPLFNDAWTILNLDPIYTFDENNIEANSISFNSTGLEDIINEYTVEIPWWQAKFIIKGDQTYNEQSSSHTMKTWWQYEVWKYWINWYSKLWREVTFRTFLTPNLLKERGKKRLGLPSPLEKIQISTDVFSGNGVIKSINVDGFVATITIISETEVI